MVDCLVSRLWRTGDIWEPCAGAGRLVRAFEKKGRRVISGDIFMGQDFFDFTSAPCQTLITNPPFSRMREFIDHAFEIGVERMALVCSERLWSCGKGLEQWKRHRPSLFANMSWREDYLNKGGSPDRMLAVSIWEEPHADTCKFEIWGRMK